MEYSTLTGHPFRMRLLLLAAILLFPTTPAVSQTSGYQQIDQELAMLQRPSLILSAGYTGAKWNISNLDPYDMASYGRNLAFINLGLHHPLITLGEAFDVIQVPSLTLSTNFGYGDRSSKYVEYIPAMVKEIPYLRTSAWATFFEYTSFRWRSEYYNVNVTNPQGFLAFGYGSRDRGAASHETVDMGCTLRDIEFGLIGSPDGRDHITMIEVGYFYNYWQRPLAVPDGGIWAEPSVFHPEFIFQGMYVFLNTDLHEGEMPVFVQFGIKAGSGVIRTREVMGHDYFLSGEALEGSMFGLDFRVSMEREIVEDMLVGLAFQGQIRKIDPTYESGDTVQPTYLRGSDSRLRVQLFSRYVLF